jgi:hypothetical protein
MTSISIMKKIRAGERLLAGSLGAGRNGSSVRVGISTGIAPQKQVEISLRHITFQTGKMFDSDDLLEGEQPIKPAACPSAKTRKPQAIFNDHTACGFQTANRVIEMPAEARPER